MEVSLLKSWQILSRLQISVSPSILMCFTFLPSCKPRQPLYKMASMMFSIFLLIEKISTLCPSALRFFIKVIRNVILLLKAMVCSNLPYQSAASTSANSSASLNFSNKERAFEIYWSYNSYLSSYGSSALIFFEGCRQSASASLSTGRSLIGVVSISNALHILTCFQLTTLFDLRVFITYSTCSDCSYSYLICKTASSSRLRSPRFFFFSMLVAARSCGCRQSFLMQLRTKKAALVSCLSTRLCISQFQIRYS